MRFTPDDRVFVLTGAGISAESGLATFRGSEGLWNGYRVEEVATPEAWHANPELVWQFYSKRRRDALSAEPNAAHRALAAMEKTMGERFYLCTQNVDDLHERAGSRRVHHMHGELFQSRCVRCDVPFADKGSTNPRKNFRDVTSVVRRFVLTSSGLARCLWIWIAFIVNWGARPICWWWVHLAPFIRPPGSWILRSNEVSERAT